MVPPLILQEEKRSTWGHIYNFIMNELETKLILITYKAQLILRQSRVGGNPGARRNTGFPPARE